MRATTILLTAVLPAVLSAHRALVAQTPRPATDSLAIMGSIRGPTIGTMGPDARGLGPLTAGYAVTTVKPGNAGLDVAIATFPTVLLAGGLPVVSRVGAAFAIKAGPSAVVLPSVGLGAIAIATAGGGGARIGAGAGLSVIVRQGKSAGFRLGMSVLGGGGDLFWFAELGSVRIRRRPSD